MKEKQKPQANITSANGSIQSHIQLQHRAIKQLQLNPQLALIQLCAKNEQMEAKIKLMQKQLEDLIKDNRNLDKQISKKEDTRDELMSKLWGSQEQQKSSQYSDDMSTQFFNPFVLNVIKYKLENNHPPIMCKLCVQSMKDGQNYQITPCCLLCFHQTCLKNCWDIIKFCPGCQQK